MQSNSPTDSGRWWTVQRGPGPIVATAIHDGHELRPEVADVIRLSREQRLREEDPFTGQAILDVPTHVIAHRSRFEFDLNRGSDEAVYLTSEQSWGLDLWSEPPPPGLVERSLAIHAAYYAMLGQFLETVAARIGQSLHVLQVAFLLKNGGSFEPAYSLGYDTPPVVTLSDDSRTMRNASNLYWERVSRSCGLTNASPTLWVLGFGKYVYRAGIR